MTRSAAKIMVKEKPVLPSKADLLRPVSTASSFKKKRSWRIGSDEYLYVKELLDGGFPGNSDVDFIGKLEAAFARKFDSKYAVTFANGTVTLHVALAAANVGPGDEVIVPPLTMASTTMAVLYQNAVPVFADIDPETLTIDVNSVREKITSRTKAIIPVSIYGLSPDMDALMSLAKENGLVVIEDDAQCFGGRYSDRIVGSIGDMSSFSFQNSKHLTCGEGGMIVTNNEDYAEKVRRFGSLGYGLVGAAPGNSKIPKKVLVSPDFKRHIDLGFNFRLSAICAAVLLAQLEKLDMFISWRKKVAQAFEQVINGCSLLNAQKTPSGYEHAYWAYTVILDKSCDSSMWQNFYDKFVELGGDGFYGAWSLTYLEPFMQSGEYGQYPKGICPVAESVQPRLIQLKTNYGDMEIINRQAEILYKTTRYFGL